MNSIISGNEKGRCFICGRYCQTETHHIFGGANRKKSEKYGLKVNLCHNCHNEPPSGVHFNRDNNLQLKRAGQEAAMCAYHWTVKDFIRERGRNYL